MLLNKSLCLGAKTVQLPLTAALMLRQDARSVLKSPGLKYCGFIPSLFILGAFCDIIWNKLPGCVKFSISIDAVRCISSLFCAAAFFNSRTASSAFASCASLCCNINCLKFSFSCSSCCCKYSICCCCC